jgi:uncharacterized protein YjbJ (UPF0337 family)
LLWLRGNKEKFNMAGKTDEAKGRVKEAVGALTGNEALKREGQVDQAVGKVKGATASVIDTVAAGIKSKDAVK